MRSKLQESIGLSVVTDGEYRRLNFQDSFGESVSGYDAGKPSLKFYESRVEGSSPLTPLGNSRPGRAEGHGGGAAPAGGG